MQVTGFNTRSVSMRSVRFPLGSKLNRFVFRLKFVEDLDLKFMMQALDRPPTVVPTPVSRLRL